MGVLSGPLKIRLIKINDSVRWIGDGDGSGFQNFVVERDGQFLLAQTRADEQSKIADNGARLRNGFASDCIHNRVVRQFDIFDDKSAVKLEVFELFEVNHGNTPAQTCNNLICSLSFSTASPSVCAWRLRRSMMCLSSTGS